MKIFIILLSLLFVFNSLHAQDTLPQNTDYAPTSIAKNTVFFELFGNGLFYSLSYDRILFHNKKNNISFRIGTCFMRSKVSLMYGPTTRFYQSSIPVEINYFKGKRHYAECSIGLGWAKGWDYIIEYRRSQFGPPYDKELFQSLIISEMIYLTLKPIGYRYQKPYGGFFFKTSILGVVEVFQINSIIRKAYKNPNPSTDIWYKTDDLKAPKPFVSPWFSISFGYTFKNKK